MFFLLPQYYGKIILIDVCSTTLQYELEAIEHKSGNVYEATTVPSQHREHRLNQMLLQQQWSNRRSSMANPSPQRDNSTRNVDDNNNQDNNSMTGLGVNMGDIGVTVVGAGRVDDVPGHPVDISVSDNVDNAVSGNVVDDNDVGMIRGNTSDYDQDDDMFNID